MISAIKKINTKIQILIVGGGIFIITISFLYGIFINNKIYPQIAERRSIILKSMIQEKLNKKFDVGLTNAVGFSANSVLINSLINNDRESAIKEIRNINSLYKKNTNFKGIKIHLHTKDTKSFLRSWDLTKTDDSLSSFRNTIKNLKATHKSDVKFELGRTGMYIRALMPLIKENEYIGSLEFMQGVGSINRDFLKNNKHYLLLMTEESIKISPKIGKNRKIGEFYLANDTWFDQSTIDFMKKIDLKKLFKNGYILNNYAFITYMPQKNTDGKIVGYHIISEDNSFIMQMINNISSISNTYLLLIFFAMIATIIFFNIAIKKIIITPLNEFQKGLFEFFDYLNRKNDKVKFINIDTNDEIYDMSQKVNENIKNIEKQIHQDAKLINEVKDVVKLIGDGKIKQKIKSSSKNQELEELKNVFNNMLESLSTNICEDLSKIDQAIKRYQKLDFREKIQDNGKISKGLNDLVEIINNMLKINKLNGKQLQTNAHNLVENVNDLKDSSDKTTTDLHETTNKLNDIAYSIKENTNYIVEMSKNAKELSQSATNDQDLANRTTTAMNEINAKITSVKEAIAIIEQIAFSTNILSLNAAVEASTAGEAGKGFAVVANEVRNLANQSADAAKTIKSLIETAMEKANEGKNIANKMIEGYSSLDQNVNKTLDIISDIAETSKKQQDQIEQVNSALNGINIQTKQNNKIATKTDKVATYINGIAELIIEDVNKKKF